MIKIPMSISHDSQEVKDYAQIEYSEKGKMAPYITLFKNGESALVLYFPDPTEEYSRQNQLVDLSFVSCVFEAELLKLVIDTTMNGDWLPVYGHPEGYLDCIVTLMASPAGVLIEAFPYKLGEDNVLNWVEVAPIKTQMIKFFNEQLDLIQFASFQFGGAPGMLPYHTYLHYLEAMQFKLNFVPPYNETNIGTGLYKFH